MKQTILEYATTKEIHAELAARKNQDTVLITTCFHPLAANIDYSNHLEVFQVIAILEVALNYLKDKEGN